MTLSFPLSLAEFFDTLPVRTSSFSLADASSTSVTGGGEVIKHNLGARLWQGEAVIDKDYHHLIAAIEARLSLLEGAGASFLIYDRRKPNPLNDPDGTLTGSAIIIDEVSGDFRELRLSGLPANYELAAGDLLAFTYGSNPSRYALHRVVSGVQAWGGGLTPLFEVVPPIRDGAQVGAAVTLNKPVCKARLIEGEYGKGRSTITEGGTIRWMQTLR